ncbi:helix-turn-helix domain-containing protein [Streptomyces sp. NPDC048411]|uniref:helix-turn-helix domain-containing protein n=1 Tax=Streptomyces sp. NPDC048411 TaxID=3157206 RepID=UPI0034516EE0
MAGRSAPTGRRVRIATELRKLRERAGLTATEAARVHGISQGQLSNIVNARFGVSGERLRAMAQNYDCSDNAFIEALVNMVQDRRRGWWSEYQELLPNPLLDLAELEHHAERLRGAITAHIPGLLQSADHAQDREVACKAAVFDHADVLLAAVFPEDARVRASASRCRAGGRSGAGTVRPIMEFSALRDHRGIRACRPSMHSRPDPRPVPRPAARP